MAMSDILAVTVTEDGRTYRYEIPEAWIVGACQGGRRSVADAVRHWHAQARIAEGVK